MRRYTLPLALLLLVSGCGYNTIQRYDEQVNGAKNQIEVQLQRRADLIPNLVATVKGYAQQEQDVFVQVAQARAGLLGVDHQGKGAHGRHSSVVRGSGRLPTIRRQMARGGIDRCASGQTRGLPRNRR